jgi:hypothetical protein
MTDIRKETDSLGEASLFVLSICFFSRSAFGGWPR